MKTTRILGIVGAAVVVALLLLLLNGSRVPERLGKAPGGNEATQTASADHLASQVRAVRRATPVASASVDAEEEYDRPPAVGDHSPHDPRWNVSDTEGGRIVAGHLATYDFAGPTAQARFDESLRKLRERPREVVAEVRALYQRAAKGDHASRSLATSTLRQLGSHEAESALSEIASEPIPPELRPLEHGGSPLQEEGLIRIAALDGLGHLAQLGNASALATLASLMASGNPLIRRYAAQEYVEAQGYSREARNTAAGVLPESDRMVVDARPLDPEDVPVVEPEPPENVSPKPAREKSPRDGTH